MLGSEDVKKQALENPEIYSPIESSVTNNTFSRDNQLNELRVGQVLGLASLEVGRYSQEIQNIIDWALNNGAKSTDDILYEIRYLSNMLGNNPNEKKIKTISRYVFLANEQKRLAKEMERLTV